MNHSMTTDPPETTSEPPTNPPETTSEPSPKRKRSTSGEQTRARILAATRKTLRVEGIAGTSARAIAKAGDFNQALIFYHFDSVSGAIVASVAELSKERMARHASRLEAATTLVELIDVAIDLYEHDRTNDEITVLIQAFAGATADPEVGAQLYAQLEPWSNMVADALERVLGDSIVGAAIPTDVIAKSISALFLGVELLDDLDPEKVQAASLLRSLRELAVIVESLAAAPLLDVLGALAPTRPATSADPAESDDASPSQ